ncbi:hypothetical protein JKF63_06457 [Porcisia hertigi]|uniref:Uncharacterized protein n=1 Tax=Porcisia hertigi TaxID=2761500 RepID=A0A836LJY7_9TRYP|nr:hypothetical protein JKF63_06457 [Porcisia hertigi]
MVSVASMQAAVQAFTHQHQTEMTSLQQEVNRMKAVLAEVLQCHPSFSPSEGAALKAIVPRVKSTPSSDNGGGRNSYHRRSSSYFSSGDSRTRSPSIALPAPCAGMLGMPSVETAGALAGSVDNKPAPLQHTAPPRCSRTVPRHSCSYDSDIADLVCATAAASDDPAAAFTRLERRSDSIRSVSPLDEERSRRSTSLQQHVSSPIALLQPSSEGCERHRHRHRQLQQDEHTRLREALLQKL